MKILKGARKRIVKSFRIRKSSIITMKAVVTDDRFMRSRDDI